MNSIKFDYLVAKLISQEIEYTWKFIKILY